jgi:hypothetical protein
MLQAKCIEMMLKLIVSNCQKGIWMILVERGSCFFLYLGCLRFHLRSEETSIRLSLASSVFRFVSPRAAKQLRWFSPSMKVHYMQGAAPTSIFHWYPPVIKDGKEKIPTGNLKENIISVGFSIAMFVYERVAQSARIYFRPRREKTLEDDGSTRSQVSSRWFFDMLCQLLELL